MLLRAGMPVAVIAEIGTRPRVIGAIGLHAVGNRIVAADRARGNRDRAVVILVIVIARRVVARSAIIRTGGERAADHGTGDKAGNNAAAAAIGVTAAIAAATKTRAASAKSTCTTTTCAEAAATPTMEGGAARCAAFTAARLSEACGRRVGAVGQGADQADSCLAARSRTAWGA